MPGAGARSRLERVAHLFGELLHRSLAVKLGRITLALLILELLEALRQDLLRLDVSLLHHLAAHAAIDVFEVRLEWGRLRVKVLAAHRRALDAHLLEHLLLLCRHAHALAIGCQSQRTEQQPEQQRRHRHVRQARAEEIEARRSILSKRRIFSKTKNLFLFCLHTRFFYLSAFNHTDHALRCPATNPNRASYYLYTGTGRPAACGPESAATQE